MTWIWKKKEWPNFQYDATVLRPYEDQFLRASGYLFGACTHFTEPQQNELKVHFISDEAITTSQIEGEYFNRESVRSSVRRRLGLGKERKKTSRAEEGIAALMMSVYQDFNQPLSHIILCEWNLLITSDRFDLQSVGAYRKHDDPMQIVSEGFSAIKVHYEAPPSHQVMAEMDRFLEWYATSTHLPALTRAGIAHLYSVCIHPFEDGNGRISRALAMKSLLQSIKQPLLISLSDAILLDKKMYYAALASTNRSIEISEWLVYFAKTVLKAVQLSEQCIQLVLKKTSLYDQYAKILNSRQLKLINRLFELAPEGFIGGLSAKNYISMTKTSPATATRDLQELVTLQILRSEGELKGKRYYLLLSDN